MVDVDLLYGTYLTEKGGDSMHSGIQELEHVTHQGTATNRAKAYHQLAQTYFKSGKKHVAEIMLDSMYTYLNQCESPFFIHIDYEPILNHFLKEGDSRKAEQYVRLMLLEQRILKVKRVNYNLVEAIVNQQTEQKRQELKIAKLKETTQHLWLVVCIILSALIISVIVFLLLYQRKKHIALMQQADKKLALLDQQLNQSNAEKAIIERKVDEMMSDNEKRQELTSLTPSILKKSGESEFRQRFEVLYPLFLPRLREKIPSITRREELLSMLIVLKQDNKEIADLLAIAPRSVLMLRHRFRQKIGMDAEKSLENFIEEILEPKNGSSKAN
jgi:DNA-binding CsgD family transcriptional regulator